MFKTQNLIFVGLWRLLEQQDFEQGYLTGVRQDVSDTEWFTFTKCFATTIKFIILHFIGTQFFQRQNPKVCTLLISYCKIFLIVNLLSGSNHFPFLPIFVTRFKRCWNPAYHIFNVTTFANVRNRKNVQKYLDHLGCVFRNHFHDEWWSHVWNQRLGLCPIRMDDKVFCQILAISFSLLAN